MKTAAWGLEGFLNSSFYDEIMRSQRRASLEISEGVSKPLKISSGQEEKRRGSNSSILQRYQASLTSIHEESERPIHKGGSLSGS